MNLDTPSGLFALSDFAEHNDGSGLAWEAFQEVGAHITALRAALDQSQAHVRELKVALGSLYDAGHNVIRRVAGDPDVDHVEMLHALTVALQNARPLVPALAAVDAGKGEP